MRRINVKTKSAEYVVSIGRGMLDGLAGRLGRLLKDERRRVFVVTSPEIWALWGERFLSSFKGERPAVLFLPPGERSKCLREVERLAGEMIRAGADRSAVLTAFGGGVVGDICGFLAAIYMRGIDYVQIPTTLLAQVDSSVGGKTGVNLREGKNLIGSFHHPRAVFAPTEVLGTLSARDLRAGLYESIKAGLIRDPALFGLIEANGEAIEARDARILERLVAASVRMKAEVVGLDERESGLRTILNFGHTIGHAIEAECGYGALLHGEAVAWGMLAALEISRRRGWIAQRDAGRAEQLILAFDPPAPPSLTPAQLVAAAAIDKKNRMGLRRFVLLKGLGKAVVAEDVTDTELLAAADTVLETAASRSSGSRPRPRRKAAR